MTNINLGTIELSATEYAVRRNVILGTAGSGKTHAGKYIAETLMDAGIPVGIVDPLGNWAYLNTMKDSANKPYNIIVVGGSRADVVLDVDTIEEVVLTALQNRLSFVVDLSDYATLEYRDEIVAKIMLVIAFNNVNYGLRHIIIEEAAEFVHQTGKRTVASIEIERVARTAGNFKVGMTFVNQTSEQMSKAILKLCDGKMLGRQTESNTINTIRKWLGESGVVNSKEIAEGLPSLKAGQFWVWSTDDTQPTLTKVPDIKTVHPSRNTVTAQDVRHGDNKDAVVNALRNLSQPVANVVTKDMGEIPSHRYTYIPEQKKPALTLNGKNYMVFTVVLFTVFALTGASFGWYGAWLAVGWAFFQK